jgi:hypothetical protein
MPPDTAGASPRRPAIWIRVLSAFAIAAVWLLVAIATIWVVAALYFDVRVAFLRIPFSAAYAIFAIAVVFRLRRNRAWITLALGFAAVLSWWLSLQPPDNVEWKPNNARVAWAEINGDAVTIHNLRNCEYRTEDDYSNCWTDRLVHLSNLRGTDLFHTNWGPKYIAHPIVSFDFGNEGHIAFSIEVRYRRGQSYSAIRGLFRQFGLIFILADERDVIRLRTNYRQGENVYLYRTTAAPEGAHRLLRIYLDYLNHLHDHPEWYNALTKNCTTTIRHQIAINVPNPTPWDYRFVLNGALDELLYSRGRLVSGGLSFPALKQQARINDAARQADADPQFSARIRAGRIGF